MRWQRWMKILGGFTLAAGLLRQTNCAIDFPDSIFVKPPPVVVDPDDDDDDTCVFSDCD